MLKRFTHNFAALIAGKPIGKGNLKITEGDLIAMPVKDRHQCSTDLGEATACLRKRVGGGFGPPQTPAPLKPVGDVFPSRTHGRVLLKLYTCLFILPAVAVESLRGYMGFTNRKPASLALAGISHRRKSLAK